MIACCRTTYRSHYMYGEFPSLHIFCRGCCLIITTILNNYVKIGGTEPIVVQRISDHYMMRSTNHFISIFCAQYSTGASTGCTHLQLLMPSPKKYGGKPVILTVQTYSKIMQNIGS